MPNYKHPYYRVWTGMKDRCYNSNSLQYSDYGGRGITVCDRWSDFTLFVEDMGERPKGYTLDRIDNDGNYEPSNCRWTSRAIQQRNRRYCLPENNSMVCIRAYENGFRVGMSLRLNTQHHKHFPTLELATEYRDLLLYERAFNRLLDTAL